MDMISAAKRGYAAFQCGTSDKLLVIPAADLLGWSESMNQTTTKTSTYRHVHINGLTLIRKAGAVSIDLRPFLFSAD